MRVFTILLCLGSFLLLANRGGRNAPSAGAPVDGGTNCAQCHSGGQFQHDILFSITDADGNAIEEYEPNTTYTVTIKGQANGGNTPRNYGFQMVALNQKDSTGGIFDNFSTDVRARDFGDRGRLYLLQSKPREDGTFSASWTTPEVNTGDITFYVSMLAANGNSGTSGDRNLSKSFVVGESITSNTEEIDTQIAVFPNPASDYIFLDTGIPSDIYDLNGRLLISEIKGRVDISILKPGYYFVKTGRQTHPFIKL